MSTSDRLSSTAELWRVLGRVYDGTREFAPADDTEDARRAHERDVALLIELEARGLVEGVRVESSASDGGAPYRGATVADVSDKGRRAIEDRRRRGECE
jgi:hypothetical protein